MKGIARFQKSHRIFDPTLFVKVGRQKPAGLISEKRVHSNRVLPRKMFPKGLIGQGKKIALPLDIADISRGESHVFGIGILNINSEPKQFSISIELGPVVDENNMVINPPDAGAIVQKWILYNNEPMEIQQSQHRKESILVSVPPNSVKGTYVFNLVVNADEQFYGRTKFYVKVR